jgi:chromosome segregation ATPase
MPVDTAAPFVAQMADAEQPLAEAMAALQQKIASLERTIQDENDELKGHGMQLPERLAALKPKEEQLAKLREKENILLQQQSRTQEGTPRPVCALPNTRCLVCIVELMHH